MQQVGCLRLPDGRRVVCLSVRNLSGRCHAAGNRHAVPQDGGKRLRACRLCRRRKAGCLRCPHQRARARPFTPDQGPQSFGRIIEESAPGRSLVRSPCSGPFLALFWETPCPWRTHSMDHHPGACRHCPWHPHAAVPECAAQEPTILTTGQGAPGKGGAPVFCRQLTHGAGSPFLIVSGWTVGPCIRRRFATARRVVSCSSERGLSGVAVGSFSPMEQVWPAACAGPDVPEQERPAVPQTCSIVPAQAQKSSLRPAHCLPHGRLHPG